MSDTPTSDMPTSTYELGHLLCSKRLQTSKLVIEASKKEVLVIYYVSMARQVYVLYELYYG